MSATASANDAEPFDAIVIGAGQAGPGVATHLVGQGKRVALVEMDKVGGTCLNRGCRPTKALRASARVAHLARTAARHGVHAGPVTVDFAAVMARKDVLIDGWQHGYADSLEHTDGLDMIYGTARFVGTDDAGDGRLRHVVAVGDRSLVAPHVFVNVGTRSTVPAILGLDPALGDVVPWLDNDRVLHLDSLPEHLVILGGSYIGLELGQLFARLGSAVTIVERGERIASREDSEISDAIARFLTDEGIDIRTGAAVERVSVTDGVIRVDISADPSTPSRTGGEHIAGTHLLVAIGRTPNTDTLDLDAVGVETDGRGFVPTDGVFRTNVEGIWALGDINGRGAFTHTSYQDYEILVDHLDGGSRSVDSRIPTYAMFTDPPLGRVGMSDREARRSGRNVLKATYPMSDVTRAKLDGETAGLVNLLVDADTERLLGASVLGLSGDEIVQIVSALMHADASCHVLKDMLPIHPTVAEFFPTILGALEPLTPDEGAAAG
ncbi:mercuric reductase [Desertimonas flava]|uniref:mercuric reductase n=1 Tax=Desertimonas flava TaxID=2064846 RepID=UPI000E3405B2|nr:mercuric reductase [Desertimonas flava]